MARRIRLSARKKPSQDRSQKTVDALLAATTRILVKEGYDRASTNRIAEVAGVSVGSLYQYFPNKESLVTALMQRHYDEMEKLLVGRLASVADRPVPEIARALVHAMVEAHAGESDLHRVLSEEVSRRARDARLAPLVERMRDALVRLLSSRRDELRCENLPLAMHLVSVAVEALTHDALPSLPNGTGAATWADEVSDLVVRYLTPSADIGSTPARSSERRTRAPTAR